MPPSADATRQHTIDLVRRTLRELTTDLPIHTRAQTFSPPNLAYARCIDLLRSMLQLVDAQHYDTIGVLYRSLIETAFTALYVQGDAERVDELMRLQYVELRRMRRKLGLEELDWEAWREPFSALGWSSQKPKSGLRHNPAKIRKTVLRERAGKDYAALLQSADRDYQLESHASEHASLTAVWNYARVVEEDIEVARFGTVSPEWTRRQLLNAALITLLLAWMAYNTNDELDLAKIERLKIPLLTVW